MTDAAIAANSSATAIFQVLKVIAVGAASTSAIIIGKTLGEAETIEECFPRVKSYTKTLQVMYLLLGIFISVTLYFIRTPILSFYTSLSPEALELAHQFILVLCVTGFGTAYQMPVLTIRKKTLNNLANSVKTFSHRYRATLSDRKKL